MLQYAYAQVPLDGPGYPSNWHAFNDPAMLAAMPAAALLFRRGDVREAKTIYAFVPDRNQLFNKSLSPGNSSGLRTAAEKGKLVIAMPKVNELPWLIVSGIPEGATILAAPDMSLIDGTTSESVSDTGELKRNWDQGVFSIDTANTQSVMGWIGGMKIRLRDVVIGSETPNAVVAVQSLDNRPIDKSKAILISLGTRSIPELPGKLPYRSEPITGQLAVRAPKGLKLHRMGSSKERWRSIPAVYTDGWYRISLDNTRGAGWLILGTPPFRRKAN